MNLLILAGAVLGGGIASLAGFGIGSVLTPLFAFTTGTKVAVAAAAIPHAVATAWRLWMLRAHVDRGLLLGFGLTSAAGGPIGALLHSRMESASLTLVFGGLLTFVGLGALTGALDRLRLLAAGSGVFHGQSGPRVTG